MKQLIAIGLLALGFTTLDSPTARGDAMFQGELNLSVTIVEFLDDGGNPIAHPPDIFIEGDAAIFDENSFVLGNGSVALTRVASVIGADPFDLGIGDGIALQANVSGNAGAPPDSLALSEVFLDGFLDILNFSLTESYFVRLQVAVDYSVESSADDPALEDALVVVDVSLADVDPLFDLFEISDTFIGGGVFGDSLVQDLDILAGPDEVTSISIFADAFGSAFATAPVVEPEPASLALWSVSALMIAGWFRRRRRPRLVETCN